MRVVNIFTALAGLHFWVSSSNASPTKRVTQSLLAKTTSGDLQGFINETAPDVRQWLGVPYAEPPLGPLRFQPPVPKKHAGLIRTTKQPPVCLEQIQAPSIWVVEMTAFQPADGDAEDCLYLDVFAPLHPTKGKLPVIIFITGGGFTANGADIPYQTPDKWVQRTQNHVVITIKCVLLSLSSDLFIMLTSFIATG
jgi:carboxylesterase type B